MIDCQNTVSCCSRAAAPSAATGTGPDPAAQIVFPEQRPVLVRALLAVGRLQHPGANPAEQALSSRGSRADVYGLFRPRPAAAVVPAAAADA